LYTGFSCTGASGDSGRKDLGFPHSDGLDCLSKQKRPRNEDNWLIDWKELLDKSGYLKK
jgi:hypothetical protein